MNKFIVLGMILTQSAVYATEADLRHCKEALNSLEKFSNYKVHMSDTGDVEVNIAGSNLTSDGKLNTFTKTNYEMKKTKQKDGTVKEEINPKKIYDQEIVNVEYTDEAKKRVKSVEYKVVNNLHLDGVRLSLDFDYRNGYCVPNVVRKSHFSEGGKIKTAFVNAIEKVIPPARQWDLNKCKELKDYIQENKDLEACLSSGDKLNKLSKIITDLVEAKPLTDKKEKKAQKKNQSKLNEAFAIYSAAKAYQDGCEQSGYESILADKKFWESERLSKEISAEVKAISK